MTKQINTWYKDGIKNQMASIDKHYDALVRGGLSCFELDATQPQVATFSGIAERGRGTQL